MTPVVPVAAPCVSTASFTERYGAVYSLMQTAPVNRVIGFTRVTFTRAAACPAPALPFAATIVRGGVARGRVRCHRRRGGRASTAVTATTALVRELLDENRVRPGRLNYAPVPVAALAR